MSEELTEPSGAGSPGYPVTVRADRQEEYARFMPLIKWLLLVPHYIALFVLYIGVAVVMFIAFFATLFTARYPRGLWDFVVGVERWTIRVAGYYLLITDKYPPFSLEADESDPVRLETEYPERVARWRPLVAWLLILPYAIVASIIGLLGTVFAFFAFFTVIFTKKIPDSIFDVIRISLNWQMRSTFYSSWLSTVYPPFEWDDEDNQ